MKLPNIGFSQKAMGFPNNTKVFSPNGFFLDHSYWTNTQTSPRDWKRTAEANEELERSEKTRAGFPRKKDGRGEKKNRGE